MGAPKNPRRKTPRKNPNMARPPHKNPLALQHKTPEGRAKFRAMIKTRKNSGRPLGVPDGYGKGRMVPIVEQAQKDAKKVVSIMKQDYEISDPRSEEALETAVEIMRTPVHNRDRLQAAKLILDFTKVKPVAKQEVTLNNAEAFLSSLLDDDGEQDENPTEETESSTEETL
jgi:hypothetical protein